MPFPLSNFPDLLISSKIWQMMISVPQFLWGSSQPCVLKSCHLRVSVGSNKNTAVDHGFLFFLPKSNLQALGFLTE